MEVRKNRKFEIGFKRQVVAQVESGELTLSEAARIHKISPTVIRYWRQKFRDGQLSSGPTKKEKELEKELERYKLLLAEAHGELDRQKKYDEWKARQRKLNTSVITGQNLHQLRKDAEK